MGMKLMTAGLAASAALALIAAGPASAQMHGRTGGGAGHFAGRTGGAFAGRGGRFVGRGPFFRGGRFGERVGFFGPDVFIGVGPYGYAPYGCWYWSWDPYYGRYVRVPGC